MSAIPYDSPEHGAGNPQAEALVPPGRPRRRFFNRKSAALGAIVACAAGFIGGIEIEKAQVSSSASRPFSSASANGPGGRSGFPFGGAGAAGGNATLGTVSSVSGNTLYVTEASGNTVKVTLSSATKVTKDEKVKKSSLRPGDSVLVQGQAGSNGSVAATSVNDTGNSPRPGSSGGASTSTTSSTSGTGGAS